MNSLFESDSWFGAVLFVGSLLLIVLFTVYFIRGSWMRDRQKRLHVFPHPHVSRPSGR